MTSLNNTAINISWNTLIISGISIDSYIVVYNQMFHNGSSRDGEKRAVFDSSKTSGVITNLHAGDMYTFQVFATVTIGDRILDGERSTPVNFTSENMHILIHSCMCRFELDMLIYVHVVQGKPPAPHMQKRTNQSQCLHCQCFVSSNLFLINRLQYSPGKCLTKRIYRLQNHYITILTDLQNIPKYSI